ncbi:4-hydroxythreonine-4-phosphate dehydrogenase PdxA [Dokdonia sinensis]|uniref:4-hydroxythreonine-4-phosphate dehydrogenase PdxA n=1 Tax=Dokdonia sinensis TaxID=2479847 RepID=A0A3M0GCU1_9FLAO|nr:4-hydroxythreonine-4-phosphate dehydrogenase PdxA [Dokdonia sinensis]RMB62971.1 4-hydroxythreonine-4-phosphate dehydrogenase PdxA [Dokdonia sinensis]
MKKEQKIKVGISLGDLNGIGPEVVLKTFAEAMMLDFCTPVIIGSVKVLNQIRKELDVELSLHGIDAFAKALEGKVNVLNIWKENISVEPGVETAEAGKYALESFLTGVDALKNEEIDALVTAPINKANIQTEAFKFPGHTDYLAQELTGDAMMLMVSESLKVGLLTDHVAVKEISGKITPELITKKIETLYVTLQRDFGIGKPKIALLGINPHVGDNGVIGDEDDKVLIPTLEKIRATGKVVYGPYAADSFFGSGNYKNFDAVLAAYHDQGLIPFKTLAFGKGVNYTAGLNKIRTSPDHGTGYDIAGKGDADHSSFREAVFTAVNIYKHRSEYDVLTENVLKVSPRKPGGRGRSRNEGGRKYDKNS